MTKLDRRTFLKASAAGTAGLAFTLSPLSSIAQSSRASRVLVGMGAGGATDSVARLYAQKLSELTGAPVVVENRPGAFQSVAINTLKNSRPDGQVLYMATGSALSLQPAIRKGTDYDPMKDFSFIALAGISSAVLTVSPQLPIHSLRELIDYSAANPGMINYASAGAGSANHIKNEYIKLVTGLKAEHIPYKSDLDVQLQVSTATVHVGLTTIQTAMPIIRDKRVRPIMVTAPRELSYLPGVPGTEEVGIKGLEAIEPYSYFGLVGPAGMPADRVAELNAAINKVSAMPEVQRLMRETLYTEPFIGSPEDFRSMNQVQIDRAADIGKRLNLAL